MAVQGLFSSFLLAAPPRIPPLPFARTGSKICPTKPVQCIKTTDVPHQGSGSRRDANYPPSFWDYNLMKSLSSDYNVLILTHPNPYFKSHSTFICGTYMGLASVCT